MNILLNSLAVSLSTLGVWILVCNYGGILVALRNKRQGIDRGYSQAFCLPQIFLLLAHLVSNFAPARLLPGWILLVAGLLDLSLWTLLAMPIMVLLRLGQWRR